MAEAEQAGVDDLERSCTDDDEDEVIERLRTNADLPRGGDALRRRTGREPRLAAYTRLRKTMIAAQRAAVLKARREGRYQEPPIQSVLAAIDAEETALRTAGPKAKPSAVSDARDAKPRRRRNAPE